MLIVEFFTYTEESTDTFCIDLFAIAFCQSDGEGVSDNSKSVIATEIEPDECCELFDIEGLQKYD